MIPGPKLDTRKIIITILVFFFFFITTVPRKCEEEGGERTVVHTTTTKAEKVIRDRGKQEPGGSCCGRRPSFKVDVTLRAVRTDMQKHNSLRYRITQGHLEKGATGFPGCCCFLRDWNYMQSDIKT